MNKYMQLAIEEARDGITKHHGGPFGSVIVIVGAVISAIFICGVYKNNKTYSL